MRPRFEFGEPPPCGYPGPRGERGRAALEPVIQGVSESISKGLISMIVKHYSLVSSAGSRHPVAERLDRGFLVGLADFSSSMHCVYDRSCQNIFVIRFYSKPSSISLIL